MYHSISAGPSPTCIPLPVFSAQMEGLSRQGYHAISLADFVRWRQGELELEDPAVVLTFDDGFQDFYQAAHPELASRGWTATVFLPTDHIGGVENWNGALKEPRKLMDWSEIRCLKEQGIDFGGHTLSHADLTSLPADEVHRQVKMSQDVIEQRLGEPVSSFAPPYGRSTARVRDEIRKWYKVSVGVRMARATPQCDLFDVPRIEMHYFRNVSLWNAFLRGQAKTYFALRCFLRWLRQN